MRDVIVYVMCDKCCVKSYVWFNVGCVIGMSEPCWALKWKTRSRKGLLVVFWALL